MTTEVTVVIIGAGVLGLAIAAEIAQYQKDVFVFERNQTFGLETSSRNSEVIHSGIYYPENSLKAKFCVEGRELLYDLCNKHDIPHQKLGKIVLAMSKPEIASLEQLYKQATTNGVADLIPLTGPELNELEPCVTGKAGLLCPSTGIIDSYSLLQFLYSKARRNGAEFAFGVEVRTVEKAGTRYKVQLQDREGISHLTSHTVVNCAGLYADRIAQTVGIDIDKAGYRLHYCKGEYFSLNSRLRPSINRLIYPIPEQAGLGIHLTLAQDGRMRLGPNTRYIESIDYKVDEASKNTFFQAGKRFLPFIELEDLQPEFAGIRPKLQGQDEGFRDFVIAHENAAGFPGLINLIGIESPGLTASPAIARHIGRMVNEILA